jgi:hypothetical protein
VRPKLFPETPLVVVEWIDASGDDEADSRVDDVVAMGRFGTLMRSEVPGWLVRIGPGKYGPEASIAHYKWADEGRVGNAYTTPLLLVKKIYSPVDGTVYYERKNGKRKPKAATE